MTCSKPEILKLIALGSLGLYVFYQFKNNPYALGSPEDLDQKADNLLNKTNLPPVFKNVISKVKTEIIKDRMFAANDLSYNRTIRDVTPRKG